MGITYSIALFPELAPSSLRQIECAVKYARLLRHRGGERIIIRGRSTAKITRVAELSKALQDEGFTVGLYTGVWGGISIKANAVFQDWVQRDRDGNPLGYRGSLRSAMLCPASPYIKQSLLPDLRELLDFAAFDTVFFDIPWMVIIIQKGMIITTGS